MPLSHMPTLSLFHLAFCSQYLKYKYLTSRSKKRLFRLTWSKNNNTAYILEKQHHDLYNEWNTENVLLQKPVLIKECICVIYGPKKMLFLSWGQHS